MKFNGYNKIFSHSDAFVTKYCSQYKTIKDVIYLSFDLLLLDIILVFLAFGISGFLRLRAQLQYFTSRLHLHVDSFLDQNNEMQAKGKIRHERN